MLRHLLFGAMLAALPAACSATPAKVHDQDVAGLANALRSARNFWFYFITRTEDYSLANSQIKAQSSIRIYRECGANCANTLDIVVQHLRNAQPIVCISGPGMENVMLELSTGEQIIYSHVGRQIKVNGHCYLSDISINKVLGRTDYIFK